MVINLINKKFLTLITVIVKRDLPCSFCRASSSYFFLFFPIFLSLLLFFLFFSNFLLFFLFLAILLTISKKFVRDLNILSLFKYVVYRVHYIFFHEIVFIIPEMVVLIINKV